MTEYAHFLFLLLVPVAAFFAYEKGNPDSKIPKGVCLALFGAAVAFAANMVAVSATAIIAAAFAIGLSFAPGNAVGPALSGEPPDVNKAEWWQKGPLLRNEWAALAGLGFFRAFLVLALIPLGHVLLPVGLLLASTIAAPLAVWIVLKKMGGPLSRSAQYPTLEWQLETRRSNKMWMWQDRIYGGLVALAAFAVGVL